MKTTTSNNQTGLIQSDVSGAALRAQTQRFDQGKNPQSLAKPRSSPSKDQSFSMGQGNVFNMATKVKDSFEIGQVIRDLVEGKF